MASQSTAAKSSRRRGVKTQSDGNPVSEPQPDGVVAYLRRIAEAQERIAEAAERQSRAVIQAVTPKALSLENAATYLGVDAKTVRTHIKEGRIRVVQHGKQRGRSILIEDLDKFLMGRVTTIA